MKLVPEIMSAFAVTDSLPGIEFCGQFIAPITSKTFVNEIINAIETKNYLRLVLKKHKKLTLALVEHESHSSLETLTSEPYEEVLKVYYGNMFVGYTDLEQILIACKKLRQYFIEAGNEEE